MKYLPPSVITIPQLDIQTYSSMEEEINDRALLLMKEFAYKENTPEIKAAFYMAMDNHNKTIEANWGKRCAINGDIYRENLSIWTN
jgi:hypothetical protein